MITVSVMKELITELKLEFSGMFGKPSALYIETLAFLNKKSSN